MRRCLSLFAILTLLLLSCAKDSSAGITHSPESISADDLVHFSTYRNGSSYSWDFGDGTSETTTTYWTTHRYEDAGNYSVRVVARDTVQTLFNEEVTLTVNP